MSANEQSCSTCSPSCILFPRRSDGKVVLPPLCRLHAVTPSARYPPTNNKRNDLYDGSPSLRNDRPHLVPQTTTGPYPGTSKNPEVLNTPATFIDPHDSPLVNSPIQQTASNLSSEAPTNISTTGSTGWFGCIPSNPQHPSFYLVQNTKKQSYLTSMDGHPLRVRMYMQKPDESE